MLTFNKKYFLWAVILFIVEVLIALYVRDSFIRPYFGDFLVVILVYAFVRTFIKGSVLKIALGVLLFSYLIEALQYFNFVGVLGLDGNVIAKTILGHGFDWFDLVAYTLGVASIILLEK